MTYLACKPLFDNSLLKTTFLIQLLQRLTDFPLSISTQGMLRVRKRITLMVITITAIFGICWVSDIITHSIDYFTSLSISQSVYVVIHILVLFNSTVNPFVYALISQTFREKLKGMICCRSTGSKGFWSSTARKPTGARKSSESVKNMERTISAQGDAGIRN